MVIFYQIVVKNESGNSNLERDLAYSALIFSKTANKRPVSITA